MPELATNPLGMNRKWKTLQFLRMWPRALFHMKQGKEVPIRPYAFWLGCSQILERIMMLEKKRFVGMFVRCPAREW
jgi:hypothetical protein